MDGRSLPSDATKSSRIRYQLALELAQACPPKMGREIALTGSVSRGLADDDSDIEWVAWVETLPSAEERMAWLLEAGATEIIPDQGVTEEEFVFSWAWCRYQSVWLEAGWQTIAAFERLLQDILSGRVTTHRPLEVANAIAGALPVRSGGLLATWQQKLTQYPDVLQKRLIAEAVQPWQFAYSYWARDQGGLLVPHELRVSNVNGKRRTVLAAETFFNSYVLFTLAWGPKPAPI